MNESLLIELTVFVLAAFVGIEVITGCRRRCTRR